MIKNQFKVNEWSLVFNIYSSISFIQDQHKINNWRDYLVLNNAFMMKWFHDEDIHNRVIYDEVISWWGDFMMRWFHDEMIS